MSTILAFLSAITIRRASTKPASLFTPDKNCPHCANRDPHTYVEHDEALYEMMGDKQCA